MNPDIIGKLLALSCAVTWAVAVILFTQAGRSMRPVVLNLYRTFLAFVLLLPTVWLWGDGFFPPHADIEVWIRVLASGFLGIALSDSLLFKCLNLMGAGLTAIVDSLYSPLVMAASWIILQDTITLAQQAGAVLVVGAVLVATLRTPSGNLTARNTLLGVTLGVMAMSAMALSIVLMKPVLSGQSVFWVTEMRLLASLPILAVYILIGKNRGRDIATLWLRGNWRHAFPGTLIGNVLSMTLWIWAFRLTQVGSAAVLNQTHIIFVVILASLVLKEPFSWRKMSATMLAMTGSIMVLAF